MMDSSYLDRLPEPLRYRGDATKQEVEILAPESPEFGIQFEDDYVMLVVDRVRHPDQRVGGYTRVVGKGEVTGSSGSIIIPVLEDSVVFVEIFRHATRSWQWELPRGYQEPGLTYEENARQELQEELNVTAEHIQQLPSGVLSNTGILSGKANVFVATIPANQRNHLQVQSSEAIRRFSTVSKASLDNWVLENVCCGFSLSALFLARASGNL